MTGTIELNNDTYIKVNLETSELQEKFLETMREFRKSLCTTDSSASLKVKIGEKSEEKTIYFEDVRDMTLEVC